MQKQAVTSQSKNITTSDQDTPGQIEFKKALAQVHRRVIWTTVVTLVLGVGGGYLYDLHFASSPRGLLIGAIVAAIVGESFLVWQGGKLKQKQKVVV